MATINHTLKHSERTRSMSDDVVPQDPPTDQIDFSRAQPYYYRRLAYEMLAELVGTFFIVQFGTASVMSAVLADALMGLFQIAAVWFIAVTLAIQMTGGISGAHCNPAVSLAFALFRPTLAFNWKKVLPYTVAQVVGAMLASLINYVMYSSILEQYEAEHDLIRSEPESIATAKIFGQYIGEGVTMFQAFLTEAFGTAMLTGVIFGVTHPKNTTTHGGTSPVVPVLIGMTVAALISTLAPMSQGGFNPARDFGPRIVAYGAGWSGEVAFKDAWMYIVAPVVGAIPAVAFVEFVLFKEELFVPSRHSSCHAD